MVLWAIVAAEKPCSPVENVVPYPAVVIGTAFVAAVPVVAVNLTATVAATAAMYAGAVVMPPDTVMEQATLLAIAAAAEVRVRAAVASPELAMAAEKVGDVGTAALSVQAAAQPSTAADSAVPAEKLGNTSVMVSPWAMVG